MSSTDRHWENFGKSDPYFGVITDPKYRGVPATQAVRDEFFGSGEAHVAQIADIVRAHLDAEFRPARALDFGCGVGRLTIPLARVAQEVVGVDVSESMLAEAAQNCARAGVENVTLLKSDDSLSKLTGRFDLLHSHIVFQHIPPARGEALLKAMLSKLDDGGVGALHFTYWVPPPRLRDKVRALLPFGDQLANLRWGRPIGTPRMEMNAYDTNRLLLALQEAGCQRIHLRFTDHGGCLGVVFFFKKEATPPM